MIHEAERVARVGLNDREIIEHLGIGQRTFYQWRQVGDAHRATIQDARGEERSEPVLTERERLCVELVEALARARARVYGEISGTALAEALGGGEEVTIREKTARVEIDGEFVEVVVERIVTTSRRAPNAQLLAMWLTRRYRHAWGTDAMPAIQPDDGERDAVHALFDDANVRDALHRMEEAIGKAQEESLNSDEKRKGER